MDQDEEMDTTPLAQPFFTIDKDKVVGSGDEEKQDGEESDSGQDEDLTSPVGDEQEEEDTEVSVTRKASEKEKQEENRESSKTNGKHCSESEESSEEEDLEEDEKKPTTCLPFPSTHSRRVAS